MRTGLAVIMALSVLAGPAALAAPPPPTITHAVADPARPKADTATDAARMPAETLAFSGVKPGMVVAELFPGGGYYSRMLSDVVGPKGHVYGVENAGWKEAVKLDEAMAAEPGRSNFTLQVQPFGQ